MKIISCDIHYSKQILDIFNDAIINSTALYDYQPRTEDNMKTWFENKIKGNFPVIGLVDETDRLLAFGSYGTFRTWPAYKYTVEHSLYVQKEHRGKGLGKMILQEIINAAVKQEYHCLIAGIDSTNQTSIRLHQSSGFKSCGKIRQVGYKFSQWLDLEFFQLLLETPRNPNEK